MPDDYDRADYLTPGQVARIWGVTAEAVRLAIREGRLAALRTPTGRYLVHKRDVRLRRAGGSPNADGADTSTK
jgi:excisionase family DNA binding protein